VVIVCNCINEDEEGYIRGCIRWTGSNSTRLAWCLAFRHAYFTVDTLVGKTFELFEKR
jgi:hypothetical protein